MHFDQLKYFLSVARRKHFTDAAEEVALSQSSLSKQISKLEGELGVKLFGRNTRNVSLTAAGEEFFHHAQRLTESYHAMLAAMRPYADNPARSGVRLGSSARIGKATLVAPMASFIDENPGVAVSIIEGSTGDIMDLLMTGGIDIAFIAHLISSLEERSNIEQYDLTHYIRRTVVEDEYYLVVSAAHPLAQRQQAHWTDLAGERLILLEKRYSINGMVRSCCQLSGFEPNVVLESNHTDAILGMVAAGSGHTLMSSRVSSTAGFSGIALVPMASPIRRNSVLVYPGGGRTGKYQTAFISHLLRFYGQDDC